LKGSLPCGAHVPAGQGAESAHLFPNAYNLLEETVQSRLIVIAAMALLVSVGHAASQQQPAGGAAPAADTRQVDFGADVQPILAGSCFACHSGERPMAQLRLDVRSMAMKGGASGPAIVPGNSADSALIHRVLGTGGVSRMPFGGQALAPEKIDILRRWIDQGAPWPDSLANETNAKIRQHWAYVPPVRPAVPQVQDAAWVRNAIDNFVLARLESEGLRPSPEASREALIRRLSLDLTGLPPSPAEVDAFLADKRPDAYDRLVERLLASPHYGERWATPWLDLARYGDSDGYDKDMQRVAWPYRDWVIDAFNRNLPFDQFTIEQLAGDLLPNSTTSQKIATGFVRASLWNTEGGTDPEEQNWVAQTDRASTIGTVYLGSTLGCSQCHNHKYDPFQQKDFYSMVAFFNNADFVPNRGRGGSSGTDQAPPSYRERVLELATPEQAAARDALNAKIRQLEEQMANWPDAARLQTDWEDRVAAAERDWHTLVPSHVASTDGTTLTAARDGSVLASGATPDSDTYIVEAPAAMAGSLSGIRVEVLPDASLPMGGPGRDYHGNFVLQNVEIEVGSTGGRFVPVPIKATETDSPSIVTNEGIVRTIKKQLWRVQASGDKQRLPRQLVLVPEKPIAVSRDSVIRLRLVQSSDAPRQLLGHFRLSVTTVEKPFQGVDILYNLRPLLQVARDQRTPEQREQLTRHWRDIAPELAHIRAQIQECGEVTNTNAYRPCTLGTLRRQIEALKIPSTLVASENASTTQPSTYIRIRGDFTQKAEQVQASIPAFLGTLPADAPKNRLGLARWLVSRDNPLTARVRVNQIWQTYFGKGIVETSEDFGSQGRPPSHPELLDWLAVQFIESGWAHKAMHRLIVTSNTYRQSSAASRELLEKDPANVLLARGPRFRVEAEMVRDIVLAASGLLSDKIGGPPVMPYQPDGLWMFQSQAADDKWVESTGEDRYRRGMYTFIRRTVRYPSLVVFDAPSREITVARRPTANTPLQALTVLNDPTFFEAAQALARRILREAPGDTAAKAAYGFRLVTARRPDPKELTLLVAGFTRESEYFQRHPAETARVAGKADPAAAAWTMVANALLSLDETITKE
jgi:uncharacterized protein DUF1553/uncharacterized protein DUF1549/cytochrome c